MNHTENSLTFYSDLLLLNQILFFFFCICRSHVIKREPLFEVLCTTVDLVLLMAATNSKWNILENQIGIMRLDWIRECWICKTNGKRNLSQKKRLLVNSMEWQVLCFIPKVCSSQNIWIQGIVETKLEDNEFWFIDIFVYINSYWQLIPKSNFCIIKNNESAAKRAESNCTYLIIHHTILRRSIYESVSELVVAGRLCCP